MYISSRDIQIIVVGLVLAFAIGFLGIASMQEHMNAQREALELCERDKKIILQNCTVERDNLERDLEMPGGM